jgi:hypothetical protein
MGDTVRWLHRNGHVTARQAGSAALDLSLEPAR